MGTLHFRPSERAARRSALIWGILLWYGCAPTSPPDPARTTPGPGPSGAEVAPPHATPTSPPVRWTTDEGRPSGPASSAKAPTTPVPHPAPGALPAVSFETPEPAGETSRWQPSPQPPDRAAGALRAVVDVRAQTLSVLRGQRLVARYPISTAARGVGNREASFRTPLGRHRVHQKFGADAPLGTVFRSRVNTQTVAPILTDPVDVEEDLILSRILWLDGLEPGLNKGPGIDSRERFIYIHGTNEEGLIGTPASHGCVRMRNRDVIALFDLLPIGAEVEIVRGG